MRIPPLHSLVSSEVRAHLRRGKGGVTRYQCPCDRSGCTTAAVGYRCFRRGKPSGRIWEVPPRSGKPDPGPTDVSFEGCPPIDGEAAHVEPKCCCGSPPAEGCLPVTVKPLVSRPKADCRSPAEARRPKAARRLTVKPLLSMLFMESYVDACRSRRRRRGREKVRRSQGLSLRGTGKMR